jgi:hypothetical protein
VYPAAASATTATTNTNLATRRTPTTLAASARASKPRLATTTRAALGHACDVAHRAGYRSSSGAAATPAASTARTPRRRGLSSGRG